MVARNSLAARKGSIASSIRPVSASMMRDWASIWSRCSRAMNAWWALKRPVRASTSSGILERRVPLARPARTSGSRSPLTRASSIARDETPVRSETTEESLIPEPSKNFSRRWISLVRSRMAMARALVRSRSSRTGSGGTNDARSSPWAPNWARQAASETSVLRPGMFLAALALTSITGSVSSRR